MTLVNLTTSSPVSFVSLLGITPQDVSAWFDPSAASASSSSASMLADTSAHGVFGTLVWTLTALWTRLGELAIAIPLSSIMLFVLVAPLVYYILRPIIKLELLHHIAKNGSSKKTVYGSLFAYCVRTELLDDAALHELLVLAHDMVDVRSESELELFHRYLLSFLYVIIFRDQVDGSLRGMFLIDRERGQSYNGKSFTLFKTGLALFKASNRGGPLIYLAFFYFFIKELIWHPFTPLYGVFKCFSVKSYLMAKRSSESVWPQAGVPTPAWEQSLIDSFGVKTATGQEVYDPVTGVINRTTTALRPDVAPISEEDLKNPDIRFFAERNPRWDQGHLLVVLYKITWGCVFKSIVAILRKTFRVKAQQKLLRIQSKHRLLRSPSVKDRFEQARRVTVVDPLTNCQADTH
ncbi:hypothetical protein CAOG_00120 [Capsaspora owczarzaki ATCC 30864]|uniref:Uncharacterized protein n=1 Tax=Capsaspora owczarzaki (strain ATCC 30864) TaxID=595528 RepID=A0A0D2TZW3_CAPO3|nr:hypothetical protein CAOG_00120 [Capsaspora owczarzaki ATCC 30864]KJE88466.1 hypothetical protein CAOG_000120 [Capsaspora owczarzaki ATCC 30864]|eukprot:XP_004364991.2 hypothetical protein CAOG_00120 [Capsaspora owczarzaki ATCC 30864]